MARQDTKLESEGAEFIVLGLLLIEGIYCFEAEAEQFTPQRIAALFRLSGSRTAGRDCAVVLPAGGLGRLEACPAGWSGEQEWALALTALGAVPKPQSALQKLSIEAARIVAEHWPEIARAA